MTYSFVVFSYEAAVVSAHPLASKVGMDILNNGGNAIDAAVATAFALGVVEPHHSGIGGGGFLLYYEAKTQKVYFLDYREASPFSNRAKGPL
ncbi:MAG: Gamma-glutamyltranspeptidase, partial [uncultured bacterium]